MVILLVVFISNCVKMGRFVNLVWFKWLVWIIVVVIFGLNVKLFVVFVGVV